MDFVRQLTQRFILFDSVTLANLMIEHDAGVRIRHAVEIKKINLDFFEPG